jgi:hypothetical protein
MITRRFIRTSLVAAVLAIAVSTFAQMPANAPKRANGLCNDGTFSFAKKEQGACSKHHGVKTWWGSADTGGSPKATETKAEPKSKTKPPTSADTSSSPKASETKAEPTKTKPPTTPKQP